MPTPRLVPKCASSSCWIFVVDVRRQFAKDAMRRRRRRRRRRRCRCRCRCCCCYCCCRRRRRRRRVHLVGPSRSRTPKRAKLLACLLACLPACFSNCGRPSFRNSAIPPRPMPAVMMPHEGKGQAPSVPSVRLGWLGTVPSQRRRRRRRRGRRRPRGSRWDFVKL
jgi:hypothetical protein